MSLLVADILDRAGSELGGFLPRLGGALVLLVVGILVARLVARLLGRGLEALGADDLAERWGVNGTLDRAGLPRSLVAVTRAAIRIALTLVVIFAALSLLGLQFLSESLNQAVLFLPKLLVAAALLLAGVVLSGLARERLDRVGEQMDLPVPLGLFGQVIVLAVFAITAAAQIAVSSMILLVLVAVVLAAAVGSLGLAFGLGGREIAGGLNAGRIVSSSFELGQRIEVGRFRGEIVGFDPVATLIRTERGTVRVPNQTLVSEPVLIEEGDADEAAAGDPSDPTQPPQS